jgi:hypothetical protein
MITILDKFNDAYDEYHTLNKHLAVDEVVLFKDRVIFKQFTPKTHKWLGMKIYKVCDSKGYYKQHDSVFWQR